MRWSCLTPCYTIMGCLWRFQRVLADTWITIMRWPTCNSFYRPLHYCIILILLVTKVAYCLYPSFVGNLVHGILSSLITYLSPRPFHNYLAVLGACPRPILSCTLNGCVTFECRVIWRLIDLTKTEYRNYSQMTRRNTNWFRTPKILPRQQWFEIKPV